MLFLSFVSESWNAFIIKSTTFFFSIFNDDVELFLFFFHVAAFDTKEKLKTFVTEFFFHHFLGVREDVFLVISHWLWRHKLHFFPQHMFVNSTVLSSYNVSSKSYQIMHFFFQKMSRWWQQPNEIQSFGFANVTAYAKFENV